MKRVFLITIAILFFTASSYATHNMSGEITYTQISKNTIECTITTYTNSQSAPADRDSLLISWGDGTTEYIPRTNGLDPNMDGISDGVILAENIRQNEYTKTHTYSEFGNYKVSMLDRTRTSGILNINNGYDGSGALADFYLETEFTLGEESNSSPTILIQPIDIATVGDVYIHIPNAYDIDGDSVSYKIVSPLSNANEPVLNYQSLEEIAINSGASFEFSENTGMLIWDRPTIVGYYSLAIEVISFRNGVQNGRIVRDMLIGVSSSEIIMPSISITTSYKENIVNDVQVGATVEFEADAFSPVVDLTDLYVSSELLSAPGNTSSSELVNNNSTIKFTWEIQDNNLRSRPYNVVVAAKNAAQTANYKLLRFRVVSLLNPVTDYIEEQDIQLFPNPSSDYINVNHLDKFQGNKYSIINTLGQEVWKGGVVLDGKINIAKLPAGTYWLLIEGVKPAKFIKG